MSDMPWVRFFPSDWLAGTRGMSAAETGIYITLVSTMYERGEPVPEDHSRLARLCGAPVATFRRTLETLIEEGKITRLDAGLWNKRVGEECNYRAEKSEAGVNAASARWNKKTNKNNGAKHATALPPQSDRNASQKPDTRSQIEAASQLSAPKFLYDKIMAAASIKGTCHPNLALGFSQITALISKGYDLDRDILPVISEKARPDISTWAYFAKIIIQRAEERAAIPAKPVKAEADWGARMRDFRADGFWPAKWGPKPGEPGCQAPAELIDRAAA